MKLRTPDYEPEDVVREVRHNLPIEFFKTLGKSFWPPSYKSLSFKTMRATFSYFFWMVLLFYIMMILVGIPVVYNLKDSLNTALGSFSAITINSSVSMNRELLIPQLGLGIDTRDNMSLTTENLLITSKAIQMKDWKCLLAPICPLLKEPYTSVELSILSNPLENKEAATNLMFGLMLFLIPSILATILVFLFIKYLFVSLIFWLLGIILIRLFNRRLRLDRIYRLGVFSLTPLIWLETINIPYGRNLLFIPLIISIIIFALGLFFGSDRGSKSY